MGGLKFFFLGPFEATLDDVPLAGLRSTKARGLLAYLASKPGFPHQRETLATLLWGEAPEEAARLSLRVALTHLRKTLAPLVDAPTAHPLLETSRQYVQLTVTPDSCWIDAVEFDDLLSACTAHADVHASIARCPVCIERLFQAVALYRGDFLADLVYADCPSFDDWRLVQQERYHRQTLAALEQITQHYLFLDNFEQAQEFARRQLALEPWREEAHRQLMRALLLSGQRSAALSQYEIARRTLAAELGVAPESETTALYDQILAGVAIRPERPVVRRELAEAPTALTPFIGREEELKRIGELLGDPACRLVMVQGPGGIGKTRLAVKAATQFASLFSDGVCYTSLRFDDAPEHLTVTLADALRFSLGRDMPSSFAQLVDYLYRKTMLLVLDDCTPASTATTWIVDLLRGAPGVKILAISHQRLNVRGEWLLRVEGLSCPSSSGTADGSLEPPADSSPTSSKVVVSKESRAEQEQETTVEEVCAAARLFAACGRRVAPDFQLTPAEMPDVLEICRLVQGMPLAIELAARWLLVLSCHEIAGEIQTNLDFLATSQKDVPERQQSLRAVFNQAWALLATTEQTAFVRLAVFRWMFDRAAAEAVADASLAVLASLVDKGLLRSEGPTPGHFEVRFSVHAVLRRYAWERLAELPGEPESTLDRHSQHYLNFLAEKRAALEGPQQQTALAKFVAQFDNVRTAWEWGVTHKETAALSRAWHSLYLLCTMRSWFYVGETMFGRLVEAYNGEDAARSSEHAALLGVALACQGWFTFQLGAHSQADKLLHRSLETLRSRQAPEELAFALSCRGATVLHLGLYDEAQQCCEESLELYQAIGNRCGTARVLGVLGQIAFRRNELDEAQAVCLSSLDTARSLGNRWSMAVPLAILGRIAVAQHHYDRAHQQFSEVLSIRRERGDQRGVALTYTHLGDLEQARGDWHAAQRRYGEALGVYWRLGNQAGVFQSLLAIAPNLAEAGQTEEALLLLALLRDQQGIRSPDKERHDSLYALLASRLSPESVSSIEERSRATSLDSAVERYRVLHPW